jgi:hypothetical protein
MGMIAIDPPSPQGSINQRDYIHNRRKIETTYKLRIQYDKNDSKESSITYIYNPISQEYKLKNYRALLLKTLSTLQPLKNTPPPFIKSKLIYL